MTVLTTILNGSSFKDIRDTLNWLLTTVATLSSGGGVTPTPAPSLAFMSAASSIAEGNSGTKVVGNTLSVTRNGVVGALLDAVPPTLRLTSSSDYVGLAASVTIPAGSSTVSFDLTINGDTTAEPDETVVITAVLAAYPAAQASRIVTITNDDAAPSATLDTTQTDSTASGSVVQGWDAAHAARRPAFAALGQPLGTDTSRPINVQIAEIQAARAAVEAGAPSFPAVSIGNATSVAEGNPGTVTYPAVSIGNATSVSEGN